MGHAFIGKAKIAQDGTVFSTHPLDQHCVDVAMALKALLSDPVTRRALAQAGGLKDLDATQVARLAAIAFWHDVGKLCTGFAVRFVDDPSKPAEAGHVAEAFGLFTGPLAEDFRAAFGTDEVGGWFGGSEDAACDFLLAALSHHGEAVALPTGTVQTQALAAAWNPWKDIDPADGLVTMGLAVRVAFPEAFEDGGVPLPKAPFFQHRFAGLVMLADWIASNPDWFHFGHVGDERAPFADARAGDIIGRMGWGADAFDGLDMADAEASFEKLFGFKANAMQSAVMKMPIAHGGSILEIESDTGTGKTEAMLARMLQLIAAGEAAGAYVALPNRTSAKQLHRRVATAVKRLLGDKAPPVLLAVPGYLRVDAAEGRRLPGFRVVWNDGVTSPERWAAENPKRFFAAPIVVGTIDQALMGVIRTGHAHMRSAAAMRMAIGIDELHASDTRIHELNEELKRRHLAVGGHLVVMSATLGHSARRRYFDEPALTLEQACKVPYPCVMQQSADGHIHKAPAASLAGVVKARSRRIRIEREGAMRTPAAIAKLALAAARKGAKVLIVRNTVKLAIETQRAIEEAATPADAGLLFKVVGKPAPHHSRFSPDDRRKLDEEVEKAFGRIRDKQGRILVGTQTIEQSLDIDCDILYADLAPIDVLIQRLGRLHRHQRKDRPAGFKKPRAVVIVPETRALGVFIDKPHLGFGQAYADIRVIEATWRLIEERLELQLPKESRMLVEKATHPEALERIQRELGWTMHGSHRAAEDALATLDAKGSLLDVDTAFGDHAMRRDEAPEDVRVRLGGLDAQVEFDGEDSPFGGRVTRLTIPGWMARTDPMMKDEKPRVVSRDEEGFTFAWGIRSEERRPYKPTFRYSRHGLELAGRDMQPEEPY